MAHIHEEIVVIKLSKLVKDHGEGCACELDEHFTGQLESVVQELIGDASMVVEVHHDSDHEQGGE